MSYHRHGWNIYDILNITCQNLYHMLYQLENPISPLGPWGDIGFSGWYGMSYRFWHVIFSIYHPALTKYHCFVQLYFCVFYLIFSEWSSINSKWGSIFVSDSMTILHWNSAKGIILEHKIDVNCITNKQ